MESRGSRANSRRRRSIRIFRRVPDWRPACPITISGMTSGAGSASRGLSATTPAAFRRTAWKRSRNFMKAPPLPRPQRPAGRWIIGSGPRCSAGARDRPCRRTGGWSTGSSRRSSCPIARSPEPGWPGCSGSIARSRSRSIFPARPTAWTSGKRGGPASRSTPVAMSIPLASSWARIFYRCSPDGIMSPPPLAVEGSSLPSLCCSPIIPSPPVFTPTAFGSGSWGRGLSPLPMTSAGLAASRAIPNCSITWPTCLYGKDGRPSGWSGGWC